MTIERTTFDKEIVVAEAREGKEGITKLLDSDYYDTPLFKIPKVIETLPVGEYELVPGEEAQLLGYRLNMLVNAKGCAAIRKISKPGSKGTHMEVLDTNRFLFSNRGRTVNLPESADFFPILRTEGLNLIMSGFIRHYEGPSPESLITRISLK